MAKKIDGYIKLNIPAGAANPSPPVGPALGQRGVNIMEFCKAFNASTDSLEKNMPIPVVITVFSDKSFSFITKTPPVSFYLKKAAGKDKGSSEPGRTVGGSVKTEYSKQPQHQLFFHLLLLQILNLHPLQLVQLTQQLLLYYPQA